MKIHIDKYKNHGVRFAIDDFGTGYSNLNLVTALDVDEIKIDKSLTSAIGTESLRYDLLPGLHEMFRSIADKIVFEGVETQEQVNYLKTFWPQSYAQGWYYSRALPLEEAKTYHPGIELTGTFSANTQQLLADQLVEIEGQCNHLLLAQGKALLKSRSELLK